MLNDQLGNLCFFGLSLNYETGLVDWTWRHAKNIGISPRYVRLDPDKTSTSIRGDAMLRYDNIERACTITQLISRHADALLPVLVDVSMSILEAEFR